MSSSEAGPLANYNSLTDKHLCGFFRNARTQRHLRRMGLITKKGEVVSEEMFRISHARREHKKHVRELLAQAIVHKTLDLERTRQIQIRNRLEDMAKKELVERVKTERSLKGDEDVLSLMSPRAKPRKSASSATSERRKSSRQNEEKENGFTSDESGHKEPSSRPKSGKSTKSTKSNFDIDSNGLPVFKRNDEVVDSQYLSRLTPRALRQFTMSLTNIDYMSGVSPYVLPQVEPVPPQTPRGQRSSTAGTPRNNTGRSRGGRRVVSLHPPHDEVQHARRSETQVKVCMKYLGQAGVNLGLTEEEPDEILLSQQFSGGNTFPVFRGQLFKDTEFAFESKRHRGYPFSITLYINGKADSRISTCCEFKHCPKGGRPFVRLGGKLGRFAFGKTESENNEGMCYRCRAEAALKKTDDDYDEDFQESSAEDEEVDYKFTVYTGDEPGAGTDANVTVTLFGESGDSGEMKLDKKLKDNFERGKKDSFNLKMKELGPLEKLKISHDGSGFNSAWFLDKVVVEHNDEKTVFYCSQWLADGVDEEDEGEEKAEVTLLAGASKSTPPLKYSVTVHTGSVKGAGTDADVFICMYGKKGKSGTKLLEKAGDDFERASKGSYIVQSPNLGTLEKLKVWHDGSGLCSSWFLEKIVVIGGSPKVSQSVFYCNDWLSDDMEDKKLSKMLDASPPETSYDVKVYTGSEDGAGTDANVFIQIYGEDNNSGVKYLNTDGKDDFEKDSNSVYKIECPKLGKLEKVRVWHDGSGFGSDWFLKKIVITKGRESVEFLCNKWLSDSKDDAKVERILFPNEAQESVPGIDYKITLFTGDEAGAGTEAQVKLTLMGEEGESGEIELEREEDSFSRGMQDTFELKMKELGKLEKLKISHDGSGFKSAWFLEKVVVDRDGDETVFYCGEWLGDGIDDKQTERTLVAGGDEPTKIKEYSVTVYTGIEALAGTDADVFMKLVGKKGESRTVLLDKAGKDDFERNSKETYKVKCKDVGEVTELVIWHDGSGFASSWYLDKVVVVGRDEKYVFYCRDWLSDSMDDKTLIKRLPVSPPEVKYSLEVYTGDVSGAGTDANVCVQLSGDRGESTAFILDKSGKDDFERATRGKYMVECQHLGNLQKLKVSHDGSGFGADWFLDKIVVTYEEKETVFNCNKWLSHSQDDGHTERTLFPYVPETKFDYEFIVYTGDIAGAGTDSKVSMTLYGEKGDSGELVLDKEGSDDFERNSKGVYKKNIKDVGEIQKLKVWHDGRGIGAGWFLDKVEVKKEGKVTLFQCNRWLDEKEDDGKIERELYPYVPAFKPKQTRSYFAEGFSDTESNSDFDVVKSGRSDDQTTTADERLA